MNMSSTSSLNQTSSLNSVNPALQPLPLNQPAVSQNNQNKKSTLWDGSNKLFDISAGSLMDSGKKQNPQQVSQPTTNLLTNEEMNNIWNNQASTQNQGSGFKPGININFQQPPPMMSNMNLMQQQMMYQQMMMQQMNQFGQVNNPMGFNPQMMNNQMMMNNPQMMQNQMMSNQNNQGYPQNNNGGFG